MNMTTNTTPITTYSFRAECGADIEQFLSASKAAGFVIDTTPVISDGMTPDAHLEFTTTENIGALRALLSTVPDGHVMLETLRACPLSENSLERNYGIEPHIRSIEGTIRFMRSEPAEQECVCCPPGGGHIYRRYVEWDAWQTNRADHFGLGPDVLLSTHATDINDNEDKRVRVTIEVLDDGLDPLLGKVAAPQESVEVSISDLRQWRESWLLENDPQDGTDCVTPFDAYLYQIETPDISHGETPNLRRNTLLSVLQKLNSNPYSLTKSECIEVVREMLNEDVSS